MQNTVPGLIFGVIIGLFIGALTLVPRSELAQAVHNFRGQGEPNVDWRMASMFPAGNPVAGALGKRLDEEIALLSEGAIRIRFREPGALLPAGECFAALSHSVIQACWSSPSFWVRKEPALALFGGPPFGPSAREYLAWLEHGGGGAILDKIYARHGIKGIPCGIAPPAAAGWFRANMMIAADLRGAALGYEGLAARVIEKLGAEARAIAETDLEAALERGLIAGAAAGPPSTDREGPLPALMHRYAFPGWQRRTALLDLLVPRPAWDDLAERDRLLIKTVCGDNFRAGLALGEYVEALALNDLLAGGAEPYRLALAFLAKLEAAWIEVGEEEAAANDLFREAWISYREFQRLSANWRRFGPM